MAVDFVGQRKKVFTISLILIIIGLLAMPLNAALGRNILNFDIEFQGGTLMHVSIGQAFDTEEDIKPIVIEATGDPSPQLTKVAGEDEVIIKTKPTTPEQREMLFESLKSKYNLQDDDELSVGDVTPTVSGEMKLRAVQAMVVAALLMLVYITFRFKDVLMGSSAVLALIHDVLLVFMVYSVFRVPVNNSFIAVMLTILGYSINDTIVIFDRVRENRGKMKRGKKEIINTSIKQSLGRTISTSVTTLIMVLLLYVFGVPSVKEFALPLVVGVAVGTYSSIFIASPLWYELTNIKKKRAA